MQKHGIEGPGTAGRGCCGGAAAALCLILFPSIHPRRSDTATKVELPVKVTASLEKALASQQAKLEEVQSTCGKGVQGGRRAAAGGLRPAGFRLRLLPPCAASACCPQPEFLSQQRHRQPGAPARAGLHPKRVQGHLPGAGVRRGALPAPPRRACLPRGVRRSGGHGASKAAAPSRRVDSVLMLSPLSPSSPAVQIQVLVLLSQEEDVRV